MEVKVKVAQSCPTLCDPMDYTVHGILQARILEWVAFPFSRSSQPRIEPRSPALQADSLPAEPPGSPRILEWVAYPFSSGSSWPRYSPALQADSLPTELSGEPLNGSIAHSKTKFSKLHVLILYYPKSLETEVNSGDSLKHCQQLLYSPICPQTDSYFHEVYQVSPVWFSTVFLNLSHSV